MLKLEKRTREIPLKGSSLSGTINNGENNQIQFESSLERDFIYLLEFDKNVKSYLEQPIEIKYIDKEGKDRKYTPDFYVLYYDNKEEIIEIKYEKTLKIKKEELESKFNAAKEYCDSKNLHFKVVTESIIREINADKLENTKFLVRYKNYFNNIDKDKSAFLPLNTDINLLISQMEILKKCSISDLIKNCAKDKHKQAELIFLTWYLLANNFILADLNQKLTLNSIIWLD